MEYQPLEGFFNVKSSLYIYIKYIWFRLVGLYGISTIRRLFNAKSIFMYIYIKLMISKHIL